MATQANTASSRASLLSAACTRAGLELAGRTGWGSTPLTAALRAARQRQFREREREAAHAGEWLAQLTPSPFEGATTRPPQAEIGVYPDVALAMLRRKMTAAGRVWLLLRHSDTAGSGQISEAGARTLLTEPESDLRICGRRQLRNLLAHGEPIFWTRRNGRIWLRSTSRVAAALGVRRLSCRRVALPLARLCEPIGSVRAHLYATFHSARSYRQPLQPGKPIARETLRRLSGTGRCTQRRYEARAGVLKRTNFAVAGRATGDYLIEEGWRQGNALFVLRDGKGKLGRKGVCYAAWQLPNSYQGPHMVRSSRCRKRVNQELVDLYEKGNMGNGKFAVERETESQQRFFDNGRSMAGALRQSGGRDAYWPMNALAQRSKQIWFYYDTCALDQHASTEAGASQQPCGGAGASGG